jgi:transketolase
MPRLPFVDVATGSLGPGICAAVGIALNARRIGSEYRTYVMLGDGESAEGSVWEAANVASQLKLDALCGITDMNAIGQSQRTQWEHRAEELTARWSAFGWHAVAIDGHDMPAILAALAEARQPRGRPTMIVARTLKGKGVSFAEDKDNWHGKAFKKGDELDKALKELERAYSGRAVSVPAIPAPARPRSAEPAPGDVAGALNGAGYKKGDKVATREAYGAAIAALGLIDPRVVALDADVKNSTFSEKFQQALPDRFFEVFIAEQVMVGAAMGLASRGAIPFPSTVACFLSRASDFTRMAGISGLNVKLSGSHAGVSIGEDGPSQMALEDLAAMRAIPNCTVLYPSDAVSTERLVALAATTPGPAYIRTTRPKTPVIYTSNDTFVAGGSKTVRQSDHDKATVVAAGITLFEALQAYEQLARQNIAIRVMDLYCLQPVDRDGLIAAGRAAGGVFITVEDHYPAGGIGDAVSDAVGSEGFRVHRLAVRDIPRSGQPEELLDRFGISARAIVEAVLAL